MSKFNRSFLQK